MYTLNITKAKIRMSINEISNFVFENYFKSIGFSKESSYDQIKHLKRKDLLLLAIKLIGKIPDSCNAKEHYQSFLRKQNRKSVKQSEIITYNQELLKTQTVLI